jgi:hypothetical protein
MSRNGLNWPDALAVASALGLEGEAAVELLSAGERGAIAGLKKLPTEGTQTNG